MASLNYDHDQCLGKMFPRGRRRLITNRTSYAQTARTMAGGRRRKRARRGRGGGKGLGGRGESGVWGRQRQGGQEPARRPGRDERSEKELGMPDRILRISLERIGPAEDTFSDRCIHLFPLSRPVGLDFIVSQYMRS
jgi:hypothetical protein